MNRFFLFFTLIVVFGSCQKETAVETQKEQKNLFFDLKGFLQKEAEDLKSVQSFKKTISINGKKEEKTIQGLDVETELSVFRNADINRPAWSEKYQIDSLFENNQLILINYKAKDTNMKTQELKVQFEQGLATNIEIIKNMDNAIAQSYQSLHYYKGKGFLIENKQKLIFSEEKNLRIEVSY